MRRLILASLILSAAAVSGGCALPPELGRIELPGTRPIPQTTPQRQIVINTAVAQLGTRYKYDGNDKLGFDDGGLAQYCYARAGIEIPLQPQDQFYTGQPVSFAQARSADLLFYRIRQGHEDRLHVGIYLGNGEIIHVSSERDKVVLDAVDTSWWLDRFVGGVDILRDD